MVNAGGGAVGASSAKAGVAVGASISAPRLIVEKRMGIPFKRKIGSPPAADELGICRKPELPVPLDPFGKLRLPKRAATHNLILSYCAWFAQHVAPAQQYVPL